MGRGRDRKGVWGGRQRRICKEIYPKQVPVCKELQNSVFKSKTHPPTNRSWRRVDRGDEHAGCTLPGAGLSASAGGGVDTTLAGCSRPTSPPYSRAATLFHRDGAGCLNVLTVSSVPAGHFHTFCPLLTTMLQYNTIIFPFDRSVN